MKSTVETLDDNRVKLSVEVDEEIFDVAVDAIERGVGQHGDVQSEPTEQLARAREREAHGAYTKREGQQGQ